MHYVERRPCASLRPWVDKLWSLSDAPEHSRERILPNGTLELVINLAEDELRIYPADDEARCRRFSGAIVSGAYDRFFGIDTREHASVIGVHFAPAGASAILGVPAGHLRNTHVELDALWGNAARWLRERLCAARDCQARFDIIEAELCARQPATQPAPALVLVMAELARGVPVGSVTAQASLSHRRLIEVFGAAVGMTPKAFARVSRFQSVLEQLRGSAAPNWSRLAAHAGYCDQSHLIREFMQFAGLPPTSFLRSTAVPVKQHHVALPASVG